MALRKSDMSMVCSEFMSANFFNRSEYGGLYCWLLITTGSPIAILKHSITSEISTYNVPSAYTSIYIYQNYRRRRECWSWRKTPYYCAIFRIDCFKPAPACCVNCPVFSNGNRRHISIFVFLTPLDGSRGTTENT